MNKEEFLKSGLLEQYLLKLTNPEETKQVEQMLQRYPEIQRELDAMHKAIEQYATSHSIPPPPHSKNKVLVGTDDIERNSHASEPMATFGRSPWRSVGSIAALFAFALLSFMLWLDNRALNEDYLVLKAEMQEQQTACEEQLKKALDRPLAFLSDPATHTTILKGTDLAPEAEVIVFWNPVKKTACVNLINLPEPPAGKQYQIWADVAGEMLNMGLIRRSSEHMQSVDYIALAASFNITLEPAGGSEHPTVAQLHANGIVAL